MKADTETRIAEPSSSVPAGAHRDALLHLAESADLSACLHDPKAPCAEARDELEWPDDWCWRCWVKEIADAALAASSLARETELRQTNEQLRKALQTVEAWIRRGEGSESEAAEAMDSALAASSPASTDTEETAT